MTAGTEPLEAIAARCSNRGRWGDGPPNALAFATASRRIVAAALVKKGRLVPLAAYAEPPRLTRIVTPSPTPAGVFGRGVLLDLPRAERRERLDPGESIEPERLDACAEALGVAIESGDLILVRTGARADGLADWRHTPAAGLSLGCAGWLHRREIALVASETPWVEVRGAHTADDGDGPLCRVAVGHTGVLFGLDFELEELARQCAEDGDHAFLFVAPPLRRAGANSAEPLAIK